MTLDPPTRRLLVRRCTERTIAAALATGSRVAVVSDDAEISRLARESGAEVIAELDLAGGLDQAAGSVWLLRMATRGWFATPTFPCSACPTWQPVWRLSSGSHRPRPVMGWRDQRRRRKGGVPLLLRDGELHRHLATATDPEVVIRIGLAGISTGRATCRSWRACPPAGGSATCRRWAVAG